MVLMMAHIDMTMLKVWLVWRYETAQMYINGWKGEWKGKEIGYSVTVSLPVVVLVVGVSRTSVGIKRQSHAHVLVRVFIIPH